MDLRRRLLSQSTVIFGARLFGAGLVFLAQAAIARLWGADVLGEYLLLIAAVNLVAVVMPLGFETIGTYFAAEYRAKGEGRLLRGFVARAYLHVLLVGALLFFAGPLVAPWFGEPGKIILAYGIPAVLMALATAAVFINSAVLVGLKRPFAGFFADGVFRPMLIVCAFLAVILTAPAAEGFSQLIWILAVGFVVIAIAQLAYLWRNLRTVPLETEARPHEVRRWWRFALPWVVIALATDYFFDFDLLLLSGHLSREELAIFGVCTRIFSLVSFAVAAVYAVTLPDIFESEAMSDRAGFRRKIGDANLVAAVLAVALFAIMAVGSPLLLALFGPSFLAGAAPLSVLCLALVVRAALGPAALVLSIHDRPYASLPSVALGLGTLVMANLLLVEPFGLMGAASAALIAITTWSVALWYTALKGAGFDVSILARLRRSKVEGNPQAGVGILPVD